MRILRTLPGMLKLGILKENPVFFGVAFLFPALAASASVGMGLRLGLVILFLLVCTGVCRALLRRFVAAERHFICLSIAAAFFASAADMFLQAYSPAFSASMGFMIPLLVVGCLTMCICGFADEGGTLPCGLSGLFLGLGAILALCVAGVLRGLLQSGTIFGLSLFGESYPEISFFSSPAGAFLALGLAAGLFQCVAKMKLPARKKAVSEHSASPETAQAKADAEESIPTPEADGIVNEPNLDEPQTDGGLEI